ETVQQAKYPSKFHTHFPHQCNDPVDGYLIFFLPLIIIQSIAIGPIPLGVAGVYDSSSVQPLPSSYKIFKDEGCAVDGRQ
ncbi:MAG TPA: hypothetical protein PKM38_10495, partial [Syntrophorhabdaceae bacterium]|nr:hypothetical protein [Syntrophorhabdaceae bacterium]